MRVYTHARGRVRVQQLRRNFYKMTHTHARVVNTAEGSGFPKVSELPVRETVAAIVPSLANARTHARTYARSRVLRGGKKVHLAYQADAKRGKRGTRLSVR
mgnify:CR=1 FL=1